MQRLAADTAYGTGKFLGWLVKDKGITPHIPVWEKSTRADGVFSRADFVWDKRHGHYICPNGKALRTSGTVPALRPTDHADPPAGVDPMLDDTSSTLFNADGDNETGFLSPLQDVVDSGVTPAERKLGLYHGDWGGSVRPVFTECSY